MPPNHRPAPRPVSHPVRPARPVRPVARQAPLVHHEHVDIAGMNYLRGFAAGVATMWQQMAEAGLQADADRAVVATLTREETTLAMLRNAGAPAWDTQKIERAISRVPGASTALFPAPSVASR